MKNILIFMISIFFSSCNINSPKEGKKIGRIVKLAQEGLICKTCEGELIRGGFSDGSGSMGNVFYFTLPHELLSSANEALEQQFEVVIYYHTPFLTWISETEHLENPHFVYKIERK